LRYEYDLPLNIPQNHWNPKNEGKQGTTEKESNVFVHVKSLEYWID